MKNNPKQNIRMHTYRKHVNLTLPGELVEAARDNGLNMSRILEKELENRLNENEGEWWRARGDLNPGHKLRRLVSYPN